MDAAKRRCVIVSASPEYDIEFISRSINKYDYIICADGGMDLLAKINLTPDLIVGDFDSASSPNLFPNVDRICLQVRKDDTDTMHCVETALQRGFENFLFLGATGGRIDHTLANLSILLYLARRSCTGIISDRYNDIFLLHSGVNNIHTEIGTTVSIMPFASDHAVLSYKGMSYPLECRKVTAEYPYTISNITVDSDAQIILHEGQALCIIVKQMI